VVALTLSWLLEPLSHSDGRPGADAAPDAQKTPAIFTATVRNRPAAYCYLTAVAAVAVAASIRMWLNPVLGDTAPFLTFYLAVAAAAWVGGFGPAALATALSVAGAWQWIPWGHGDLPPDQLGIFVSISAFAAMALILGGITAAMRATSEVAARLSAETNVRNAELQMLQAELRHEHERFNVVLDSLGEAVVTADPGGAIAHMNPPAERLTGWRLREARGQPLVSVIQLRDAQTRAPLLPQAAASGEAASASESPAVVLLDRKGKEHTVLHLITPIADRDGNSLGCVVTLRTVAAG
jgi:PAS domain S-box-containing protein